MNKDLENFILTMVKDISATNMFDIMSGKAIAKEVITHIITIKPDTEPIKQKSRDIPHASELKTHTRNEGFWHDCRLEITMVQSSTFG